MVVPFVLQRSKGVRMLAPADFGVCDYNSVVGDRNTLAMIADDAGLVGRISAEHQRPRHPHVPQGARRRLRRQPPVPQIGSSPTENAAYHAEVGDDFEAWQRRTVSRKFSKELGRLQRQTEREFGGYEHRPAAPPKRKSGGHSSTCAHGASAASKATFCRTRSILTSTSTMRSPA